MTIFCSQTSSLALPMNIMPDKHIFCILLLFHFSDEIIKCSWILNLQISVNARVASRTVSMRVSPTDQCQCECRLQISGNASVISRLVSVPVSPPDQCQRECHLQISVNASISSRSLSMPVSPPYQCQCQCHKLGLSAVPNSSCKCIYYWARRFVLWVKYSTKQYSFTVPVENVHLAAIR